MRSHHNAARADKEGFFDDLIFLFHGLEKDSFVRSDTSIEKLAKLKPAFDRSESGSLTAGNSTPLTDGAAACLLSSAEWAESKKITPQAYLTDVQVSAVNFVEGEGLLMAPTVAVSELLKRNSIRLQDFDYDEIHEAFAWQVLCILQAWESADYRKRALGLEYALGSIDLAKMNINGSSLAVVHPFAAIGTRVLATAAKLLKMRASGRALISICTAGGMGIAAIVER